MKHAPCHICGAANKLAKPDYSLGRFVTNGTNHLTCAQTESYALGGCYDQQRCGFLQGFAEKFCCGDAAAGASGAGGGSVVIDPNPVCPPVSPDTGMPMGGGGTACFGLEDNKEGIKGICVDSYFDVLCQGTMNEVKCKSCSPQTWNSVGCSAAGFDKRSYELDCSNVKDGKVIRVCDSEVIINPLFSPFSHTSSKHNSSSSNGGSAAGFVFLIVLFGVRLGAMASRRSSGTEVYSSVENSSNQADNSLELSTVPTTTEVHDDQHDVPIAHAQQV